MTLERDLAPELDRSLSHLPSVPATTYLLAARRRQRRRRALTGVAASVVLAGGLALVPTLLDDAPAPTPVATPGPGEGGGSLTPQPVTGMPALDGVDAFTTDGIPEWAQEYGNHGPVAVAPDGRLWVAPGERVTRVIVDPYGAPDSPEDRAYAVEATYEGEQRWVVLPAPGLMEPPGLWTDDFELWTQDMVASVDGGPSFAERLVRYAGAGSDELVARRGVELVRQVSGIDLGPHTVNDPRNAVAEVRRAGATWFVLARVDGDGRPTYETYEPAVSAPDLDAFAAWLRDRG
jgi:hypothetical protein